jgi:Ni/Co efflux regulator RcnB
MRKLLISLLLAGAAATPALADPGDHHWDHQSNQSSHQQSARSEHQDRGQGERPQFNGRGNFTGVNNGAVQQNFARGPRFQQQNVQLQQQNVDAQREAFRAERDRYRGQRQGFQGQVNDQALRQSDRQVPNVMRVRNRTTMVNEVNGRDRRIAWNRDWRNDRRYDWRNYRNHHRSIFHLGIYLDPFGYGYQPFGIGYQLMPAYYGQNYWFDPGLYGLPYPPPGTQWVRYWNDALLVDVYTGQVVDVIRNFFW